MHPRIPQATVGNFVDMDEGFATFMDPIYGWVFQVEESPYMIWTSKDILHEIRLKLHACTWRAQIN